MKKPLALVVSMLIGVSSLFLPAMAIHADSIPTITEYPVPASSASPLDIATGSDGNLWFTSGNSNNEIAKMTPSGMVTEYSIPATVGGSNASPQGITEGPDGAIWFTETGSSSIGRISSAGVITQYLIPLSSDGSPADPQFITTGPGGNLWFTDNSANNIDSMTTSGAVTQYAIPTSNANPKGITVGSDGDLWFTESINGASNIGRVTTSGDFTEYRVPSNFARPYQIAAGSDGSLWFTELAYGSGGNIGRITTSGTITEFPTSNFGSQPAYITPGPDGNLWFTENGTNNIASITPTGVVTEYPIPTEDSGPNGITVGPDGNLWFAESAANKLGTVVISGSTTSTPILAKAIDAGESASGSFAADADFSGGTSYASAAAVDTTNVNDPAPQEVYQTARYGNFTYTIPNLTPNAQYTAQLDFNELYWGTPTVNGGVGSRVFNVSINGSPALSNFDIFAAAGGANKAIAEQLPATADANGNVTIQFTCVTDSAMVSGIELYTGTVPAEPTPSTVSSAMIAAGGSAVGGFSADTDFAGGSSYSSTAAVDTSGVTNSAPEVVYQNCRYGNFTYTIPNLTPNTNYKVRLDFNELYFNSAGSRVFNVDINGSPVLSNFDIFATAGGANKAIAEDFTAHSDANGMITIQFSSVVNNAMVNGIEISPSN